MIHSIKLMGREQQTTNKWAGGTTTQLAIYPEDGSYGDRNFIWRLSTAVVELEESIFTKLPGFDRIIMALEGELELIHEKHHKVKLKQFYQDSFKGEWNTISYGKARDFNLMLKEGTGGSLKYHRVMSEEEIYEAGKGKEQFYAFYCYHGSVEIALDGQKTTVKEGELLLVHYCEDIQINIKGLHKTASDLVSAQINI